MAVNSDPFGGADNAQRALTRRDGSPLRDGDIRGRVQRLGIQQQRFQRFLAAQIAVDDLGLETMDHLMSTGPATPTELARKIEVSTAAMSLVLGRLEDAGHVRRERHPTDGRKYVISPTDESVRAAYGHVLPLIEGMEEAIARTDEADRAVIVRFLDDLLAVYDDATGR
jgi:DNA-binding MarR family transcriptional regulator